MTDRRISIDVFATCPQSRGAADAAYVQSVKDVALWSERAGCKGILVYSDNGLVDPWQVSQIILQNTARLCPLVAVQPVYMHPYTAAKQVATLGALYGRRLFLNMIAGGFKNDLTAMGDETPHDDRYVRLTEYTLIIKELLESRQPVTFDGKYYRVSNLTLSPELPAELAPGVLVSGSSEAGLEAARTIGAIPVKYPARSMEESSQEAADGVAPGIRVGVIAREDSEQAWRVAHERFPPDRGGQLAHQLAMKTSDSQWHRQLGELAAADAEQDDAYWLGPFQNYKTFCPYLVGSYERVAAEIARYVGLGFRTFILDIPPDEEELHHTSIVFSEALQKTHV